MTSKQFTVCRACHPQCGLIVEFDDYGKPLKTIGDKDNPAYFGYSCIKGRELANNHALASRLLYSQKRLESAHHNIDWRAAASEIAKRVNDITEQHGPNSVALYIGTFGYNNLTAQSFALAWMQSINSEMIFTSVTIDQPGKAIAGAKHGMWLAGPQRVGEWDGLILVGTNPLLSMNGGLGMNPARNLHQAKKRGMKLIVIDPRVSDSAKKADLHLQCKPGADAQILAAIARQIIDEQLYNEDFVLQHIEGFNALRKAVAPFDPDTVANYAGLKSDDIILAARLYAQCRKGSISAGTGANMSGFGNITEYLVLAIMSLLGHWRQAGEEKYNNGVFIKPMPAIAAASGPFPAWGFGKKLRVRDLEQCPAGLPTAALADEILLGGEGQIKALFVLGGNPMLAWPDQLKTYEAMQALDLLVCVDPVLSKTAELADYVIAPKLHYEVHGNSALNEFIGNFGGGWGFEQTYGQVCDPIMDEPQDSNLVEEFAFFKAMANHQQQPLKIKSIALLDPIEAEAEQTVIEAGTQINALDAWDATLKGAPISHRKARSDADAYRGKIFKPEPIIVEPAADNWPHKLQIGDQDMMEELANSHTTMLDTEEPNYPFRLISRRLHEAHNSNWRNNQALKRKYKFNPAFMNSSDMQALKIEDGSYIEIRSARASILGIAIEANDVRTGCVSMAHGWGSNPLDREDPDNVGSNTGKLCFTDQGFDQRTGIPRMSNIPVAITRAKNT